MNKLKELINKLCPNGVEYKNIQELCKISRGKVMSKDFIKSNAGEYPVYSSQTENNGELGKISTYDFDGEYLTWTTDGANAGSVFYRKGKFSVTNVCGLLEIKNKVMIPKFLYYVLSIEAPKYVNAGMGNPKLMSNVMAKIRVAVPPLEVQCEIVHILDDFTLLSAELSAELKARQKQYEYYLYKLISDSKKITKNKLYELTIWDKKFNAVENYMQPNVKKYPTLLAVDLFNLERENGNVFLLSTGGQRGWTTEEVAGDNISEGEVVTIPWGKSRPVQEVMKYYCGKFVTGDNRIATSNDIKKLNNKYLFYWMQTQSERIDKFYRGSGIQHPNMRNVLTLEIELPSIDEQKRIVSILDKFEKLCNDISKGLPAEIEARQKQYEYYRDKLLTFKELKVNE